MRFASDPLHFTGGDLASSSRARRSYAFGDSDDSSEDSEESEVDGTDALQIALRDKEEALVQSALARIRRAQEKGKREVKLNQDELDALENRRKRMQAAATTKARKGSGSSGGSDREKRRRSDRISIPIAAATESLSRPSSRPGSRRDKITSRRSDEAPHPPAASNPPGMVVAGLDGLTYATPLGTYPSNALSNSQPPSRNSPARPRSATTQQLRGQPPPIAYFTHQQPPNARHFSDGVRPASSSSNSSRRPLPDEAEWQPTNSRRSSAASSQGFMVDPFDYQVSSNTSPPIPSQYFQSQSQSQQQPQQGRRNVSNPADVTYSSIRRTPPGYASQNHTRLPISTSDPSLRHRSSRGPGSFDSSEEEDESDDLGNGVQVFVEEEREPEKERERDREKERAVARKPVAGRKKGKR